MAKKPFEYTALDNEWSEEEEFTSQENKSSSAGVQLSPIIQPIAFVQYSTQDQPLLQYGDSNGYSYEQAQAEEDQEDIERTYEYDTVKKVRFTPIFLSVLSLLVIAVIVAGEFVLQQYLSINDNISGYAYIMQLVDMVTAGQLVIADLVIPGAVALIALFALINFIAGLIKMKSRGACAISKLCLFFMITLSLTLTLINIMNDAEINYGLYIVTGLSLLSLIIGYLTRKDEKYK